MAGSQKITLWGPQRTPLGILRVNRWTRANNKRREENVTAVHFTQSWSVCCTGAERLHPRVNRSNWWAISNPMSRNDWKCLDERGQAMRGFRHPSRF